MGHRPRLAACQVGNPTCDPRAAVDERHLGDRDLQLFLEEREVRASKNDGVDLITPRRRDHWFNRATNIKSANPFAAKLRLSKFDEFGRAVPDYRAIRCEPL